MSISDERKLNINRVLVLQQFYQHLKRLCRQTGLGKQQVPDLISAWRGCDQWQLIIGHKSQFVSHQLCAIICVASGYNVSWYCFDASAGHWTKLCAGCRELQLPGDLRGPRAGVGGALLRVPVPRVPAVHQQHAGPHLGPHEGHRHHAGQGEIFSQEKNISFYHN